MLSQVSWTCIIIWCLAFKSLNSESTSKVENCRTPNDKSGSESPITNLSDGNVPTHKNLHLLPKDCGLLNSRQRLIGNIANLFDVPWIALLSHNTSNGTEFRCSGSVINNRYILTAAHCTTYSTIFKVVRVRCGEQNLDTEIDCEEDLGSKICAPPVQDMEVEEIISHPNFNPNTYRDDIALIRLARPLNTSWENVKPICLPVTSSIVNHNRPLIVPGWNLRESRSAVLLKTQMTIASKENCEKASQRISTQITDKQLCSDKIISSKSCSADGGSPLQGDSYYDDDIHTVQYGVLSYGPPYCASIDFPFVFTKTESYMTWILDNLRP